MKILALGNPEKRPLTNSALALYLRKRGPSIAILLSLIFLVNLPALWNGLAGKEDWMAVQGNEMIRSLDFSSVFKMFTSAWQGKYQPLVELSLALDFFLGGFTPWVYHAQNIVWHLVNVWLVYRIFRRLGNNRTKGWMVALFFGIHPLHAESVAWISGRRDVLYAAGFLMALLYYYRYTVTNNKLFYRISLAAFVWACLCKPMAMSFPLLLPLLDYLEKRKISWHDTLSEKFPFFFIAVVLAWFTFLAQLDGGRIGTLHNWQEVLFVCRALVFYITRTLMPLQLSAFYPFPEHPELRDYLAPVLIVVLLFTFFRILPFSRITATGWLFFFICILPVLQLFPAGQALMADRNHYLPGLGLIYLVVEFLWIAWYRYPRWRNLLPLGTIALALIFSGLYIHRIRVWKNDENYYGDILSYNPTIYFANLELAQSRIKRFEPEVAVPLYFRIIRDFPDSAAPRLGAAHTLLQSGNYRLAESLYRSGMRRTPDPERYYADLAHTLMYQQKWDSARYYFRKVIRLFPKAAEPRVHYAETLSQIGADSLARHYLYEALNIDSNYGPALYQMALLEKKTGNWGSANSWMKAAAKAGVAEAATALEDN